MPRFIPGLLRRGRIIRAVALALACLLLAVDPLVAQPAAAATRWVATWATALVPRAATQEPPRFANQTLRQIVRVTLGGDRVRVVLSNTFGTAPLEVGAAGLALRQKDAAIAEPAAALTFSGRRAITIPAGAVMVSDPVTLLVPPLSDVAIDVYLPGDTATGMSPLTGHTNALQTSYVSRVGNHAGGTDFPVSSTVTSWFFLGRVEVAAPPAARAIVAFGDSITDGSRSTPDTNGRWPDHLAALLRSRDAGVAVLNMGIAGNRVLADGNSPGALARLDRDVLVAPNVTHVVFMEGINDIGRGATAEDLIAAHVQVIERARARGLKVIGATLTPIEETTFEGYYTPEHEAARQGLNRWIRTSGMYDGVIDFDAVLRDPARPARLRPEFAAPDFIHPNDAGYAAMAKAVDLALFDP